MPVLAVFFMSKVLSDTFYGILFNLKTTISVYSKGNINGNYTKRLQHYITKTRPCNIQQYFTAVKMFIFRRFFLNIFLIFAQNIDCGYTLEPPQ